MSFNKKFLSKSPLAYHGGPHNGQPNVKANTKAFSTMSDILPNKNITPPQQSTYGLGTSTNANWDKPKKPSDEQKAKSLEMQKKMLEVRDSKAGTKVLDDIQDKLETAGMTPLAGIVPDAINTGISAARGLSAKFSGDKKAQLEAAKNMGIHIASAMPIGGFFTAGGNKIRKYTNFMTRTGRAESKLLKNPNYTRVYTTDGSSKIMEKSKALHLNRIEDANITNKVYKNPKTGYEDYNWANRTDKSDFQNIATKHYLDNTKRLGGSEKNFSTYNLGKNEDRRLISMYFDPKDAENFSVFKGTKKAYEMSKNKANEFVIPPDIMKNIRNKKSGYGFTTTVGSKSKILEQMNKF